MAFSATGLGVAVAAAFAALLDALLDALLAALEVRLLDDEDAPDEPRSVERLNVGNGVG